jgi:hypothetical protein
MFNLRFDRNEIQYWAERYDYPGDAEVQAVAGKNKGRGYLTREEFLELCKWKTPRSQPKCQRNQTELIREATGIALSSGYEELRIGVLMVLHGVGWPTASVILHFWHNDPYSIIDFRALWSIGFDKQPNYYTFDLWWKYTAFCRELAEESKVSMRTLDRALWQFSSEKQKKGVADSVMPR